MALRTFFHKHFPGYIAAAANTTPLADIKSENIDTSDPDKNAQQIAGGQPQEQGEPDVELAPKEGQPHDDVNLDEIKQQPAPRTQSSSVVIHNHIQVVPVIPETKWQMGIRLAVKIGINTAVPAGAYAAILQNSANAGYALGRDLNVFQQPNLCAAGMGGGWIELATVLGTPLVLTLLDEINRGPLSWVDWGLEKIKQTQAAGQKAISGSIGFIAGGLSYAAGPLMALGGFTFWKDFSERHGCDLGYRDEGNYNVSPVSTPVAAVMLTGALLLDLAPAAIAFYKKEGVTLFSRRNHNNLERMAQAQIQNHLQNNDRMPQFELR